MRFKHSVWVFTMSMAALLGSCAVRAATPTRVRWPTLPPNTRQLFDTSMQLAASSFDATQHLILRPGQSHSNERNARYLVRESSWYALGLLLRDGKGDRALASDVLHAVLANQYRVPGKQWFGTFKRTPEEPEPALGTIAFTGYDPNWREFIGTTFEIILIEFPDRLPKDLVTQLYDSIELAVRGEQMDGRLKPTYSNIALMYGALWDFTAQHSGKPEEQRTAAMWTDEVSRLYHLHNSFFEYNSPTYYGVDLFGLALWRDYGSSQRMRDQGAGMESSLWSDIAAYYQPALRNISGPYDRSYGMDMETYVAVTGVWLRSVIPAHEAPLPAELTLATDHMADVWFAPLIAAVGTRIPADAMQRFSHFSGPHLVTRQIDDQRTATAWIGEHSIWGGESTSLSKDAGANTQFHPATAQWRTPAGAIGWMYVQHSPKIDAFADRDGISIKMATGDIVFRLNGVQQGPDSTTDGVTAKMWSMPGMTATVESDGEFSVERTSEPQSPHGVTVRYRNATYVRLHLHDTAAQSDLSR